MERMCILVLNQSGVIYLGKGKIGFKTSNFKFINYANIVLVIHEIYVRKLSSMMIKRKIFT